MAAQMLTAIETEVHDAYNRARADPASVIDRIEERLQYLSGDGKFFELPGNPVRLVCKEGRAVYEEAIEFLHQQQPVPPLELSVGLTLAARVHCLDQGPTGATGHGGPAGRKGPSDRSKLFGAWEGTCGENIDYGAHSGDEVVMALIVDDGVPGPWVAGVWWGEGVWRLAGV